MVWMVSMSSSVKRTMPRSSSGVVFGHPEEEEAVDVLEQSFGHLDLRLTVVAGAPEVGRTMEGDEDAQPSGAAELRALLQLRGKLAHLDEVPDLIAHEEVHPFGRVDGLPGLVQPHGDAHDHQLVDQMAVAGQVVGMHHDVDDLAAPIEGVGGGTIEHAPLTSGQQLVQREGELAGGVVDLLAAVQAVAHEVVGQLHQGVTDVDEEEVLSTRLARRWERPQCQRPALARMVVRPFEALQLEGAEHAVQQEAKEALQDRQLLLLVEPRVERVDALAVAEHRGPAIELLGQALVLTLSVDDDGSPPAGDQLRRSLHGDPAVRAGAAFVRGTSSSTLTCRCRHRR